MKRKEEKHKCPEGYLPYCGQTIDMLGKTELWRIHEHHAEPELTRIPQDLVADGPMDSPHYLPVKHIPREWGKCLYYKVV